MSRFSVEMFCLTAPKNSVGNPSQLHCFPVPTRQNLIEGGGGSIKICVKTFVSHSAEIFRRGILYCCINFVYGKSLDQSVGVSRLSVEIFLAHSAEISIGESFIVALISCTEKEKRLEKRDWGVSSFSVKKFCVSQCRNFP